MSDSAPPSPEDLVRQVSLHVASLRSAGIEWVPAAPVEAPRSLSSAARSSLSAPFPPVQPQPPTPSSAPRPVSLPTVAPVVVANVPQPALFVAYDTPEDSDDIDRRISELEALKKGVERCTRCAELASTRTQIVFGVGPLDPELCFIGEAPGYDEDKNGEPFVGAAGQLLTRIITACGLSREEVYICNVLRCRPPGNRTPLLEEADNCREYLEKTIELVRPKFLCVLGNTPLKVFLGLSRGITQMRGTWHDYRGIPVMCTFHPSYLLRKPEDKKLVWDDMKALLTRMGRTIPGKQS